MEENNHRFDQVPEDDAQGASAEGHTRRPDGSGEFSGLIGVETPFGQVIDVEVRTIPAEQVVGGGVGYDTHWQTEGFEPPMLPERPEQQ